MSPQQMQSFLGEAKSRLLVLALAWALQLFFAISCLGIWSSHLNAAIQLKRPGNGAQLACEAINMAVAIAVAMCTLLEVIRHMVKKLTAPTLLYAQLVQSACAAILVILSVYLYSKEGDNDYTIAPLVLSVMLLLATTALAVYAIVSIRRANARYVSPEEAKGFRFAIGPEGALCSPPQASRELVATSWPSAGSGTHRRNVTYNHKRDTQFDDYVATLLGFPPRARLNCGLDSARPNDLTHAHLSTADFVREERCASRDDVLSVVQEEDDEHEYG